VSPLQIVHATFAAPSPWLTVGAILLGAGVGAAGAILASVIAVRKEAEEADRQRRLHARDEALYELLPLLPQLESLITNILPAHKPAPGQVFRTELWASARSMMATLTRQWTEFIAARVADSKVEVRYGTRSWPCSGYWRTARRTSR